MTKAKDKGSKRGKTIAKKLQAKKKQREDEMAKKEDVENTVSEEESEEKKEVVPEENTESDNAEPKEEKVLALTELQMKDIDLYEARTAMQEQVLVNQSQEMTLLNIDYKNKQAQIKAKMKSTRESKKQIQRDYNAFVASIEADLGIKLADYTCDDTGVLTYNPIEEPPPNNGETLPDEGDGKAE